MDKLGKRSVGNELASGRTDTSEWISRWMNQVVIGARSNHHSQKERIVSAPVLTPQDENVWGAPTLRKPNLPNEYVRPGKLKLSFVWLDSAYEMFELRT